MQVLITGGAGFIGSHLVDSLLADGHSVTVIDDLSTGRLENLAGCIDNPCLNFIEDSILNKDVFKSLPTNFDIIFHLAAAVGVKYILDNPLASIRTNVHGSENVFSYAHEHKIKILLTSTSEVYGKLEREMLSEDDDRVLGSTSISRWSYSCAKALDEFIAFAYFRTYEVPVIITRLFNTCGPRQVGRYGMVIPRFIRQALRDEPITVYGDGNQIRSFTYVGDTVRALRLLADNENCVGEVFNIGGNEPVSIADLAAQVKQQTKSLSEIKFVSYESAYGKSFEDMKKRVPNIAKIKQFTGFEPRFGLNQILDNTIMHIKEEMNVSAKFE